MFDTVGERVLATTALLLLVYGEGGTEGKYGFRSVTGVKRASGDDRASWYGERGSGSGGECWKWVVREGRERDEWRERGGALASLSSGDGGKRCGVWDGGVWDEGVWG